MTDTGLRGGMLAGIVAGCMLFCACKTTRVDHVTRFWAKKASVSVETYLKIEYLRTSDGVELVRNDFYEGVIAGDAVGRFAGGPDITIGDVAAIEGRDYRNARLYITPEGRVVENIRVGLSDSDVMALPRNRALEAPGTGTGEKK